MSCFFQRCYFNLLFIWMRLNSHGFIISFDIFNYVYPLKWVQTGKYNTNIKQFMFYLQLYLKLALSKENIVICLRSDFYYFMITVQNYFQIRQRLWESEIIDLKVRSIQYPDCPEANPSLVEKVPSRHPAPMATSSSIMTILEGYGPCGPTRLEEYVIVRY